MSTTDSSQINDPIGTPLRNVCAQPGVKVGTFVCEFNTPGIGYLLKAAGCDFAFVDMEHSGFDVSTLKSLLRYFEAAQLPCFVRPPGKDYYAVARVLDMGAEGLILPMVGSVAEAQTIINNARYTPLGQRGVAPGIAHDRWSIGPVTDKLMAANRRVMIVPLIETVAGLEAVDEIAALEGIDGLWIGHYDLSCSMGIPGQFEDPRFVAALERVANAARANGIPAGRVAADVAEGAAEYARGYELIAVSGDAWLLQQAMLQAAESLRAQCS